MTFPLTKEDRAGCIVKETAKMSYPSSMSRGKKPVVMKGTKALVADYFVKQFSLASLEKIKTAQEYEKWHFTLTRELARHICKHVHNYNEPMSVAAKFANTFMHQLTKYSEARHLLPFLHVPLDARVFAKLRKSKTTALSICHSVLKQSPYSLRYRHHLRVQKQLLVWMKELNERSNTDICVSRIDFNWLWL
ncbi:hypothetical protein [Nitrogeniibacter aestuarii]|uniref:hypothetical protein n=1 Tax=Nitrogeniibacter aestuarii TaxID=2815343 RepID=UPI001E4AB1C9|nr:hypothetical protein [Nitrogeniibacter aestuarii]